MTQKDTKQLEQMVCIEPTGSRMIPQEVVSAIREIFNTDSGRNVIEAGYKLHGNKPLEIVISDSPFSSASYVPISHKMIINPDEIKKMQFYSQSGGVLTFSVKRLVAHELLHATQENVYERGSEFRNKVNIYIQDAIDRASKISMTKYESRLQEATGDYSKLKNIFGEIFDCEIAGKIQQESANIKAKIADDTICVAYVKDFEVPAIEFENEIMQACGEPGRTTDYINSAVQLKVPPALIQKWVEEKASAQLHQDLHKSRIG